MTSIVPKRSRVVKFPKAKVTKGAPTNQIPLKDFYQIDHLSKKVRLLNRWQEFEKDQNQNCIVR